MACRNSTLSVFLFCLIVTSAFSASVRQLDIPTIAGDAPDPPAPAAESSANTAPAADPPAAPVAAPAADTNPAAAPAAPAAPAGDGDSTATNGTAAIPAPGTSTAVGSTTLGSGTAWEFLSGDDSGYTIFARCIRTTGYSGVLTSLQGGKGLTIFAPNDAAFATSLADLGYTSSEGQYEAFLRMISISALYEIVGYHILPLGYSLDMLKKSSAALLTYSGELVTVSESDEVQQIAQSLTAPKINSGAILVDNAIVYPIDRVLFPFDVDVEKTKNTLAVTPPITNGSASAFLNTDTTAGNGTEMNCFPASATVLRKDGAIIRMDRLEIGDEILVDDKGTYSKVFLFTHRDSNVQSSVINIRTVPLSQTSSKPNLDLTVSGAHYVHVKNKQLTRADAVREGDIMYGLSGEAVVNEVTRVSARGLYAPHTEHGDVVVNGIVCSTYTDVVDATLAHASLGLIRALRRMAGLTWRSDSVWDMARRWVSETRTRELYGLQGLISR